MSSTIMVLIELGIITRHFVFKHTRLKSIVYLERGSSVVEWRTRHQSPGSNPPLLPFRRLGIFVLSIDTPVHSVYK